MRKIFLFALLGITSLSLRAQLSEETRQVYCQNNRDEIARLTKVIPDKKAALAGIWSKSDLDKAKKDSGDLAVAIKELNRFPLGKKDKEQSDKEYVLTVIDPAFDMEKKYTGAEKLDVSVDQDFGYKDKLPGSTAGHILTRLRVIRDSLGAKVANQRSLQSKRKTMEAELKQMEYMMSYHKNRMIELKCEEKPAVTTTNPPPKVEIKPVTKPAVINLTETSAKYGSFYITLKNTKDDIYEGVYSNGVKGVFILKQFTGELFDLQRTLRTNAFYTGTMNGNSASGRFLTGGVVGTFTATF